MVEDDVLKVLLHLLYTFLKLMVDLDQLVIVIMTIANCQSFVIPFIQILKFKSILIQSIQ